MGDLIAILRSHERVGFDTPVFMYHIEQGTRWSSVSGLVLRALAQGHVTGMTSVLTIMELTKPLRLGRPEAADAYALLVADIDNLAIVDVDTHASRIGAGLRAAYGIRTPDALHIGACLANGATAFVTNDRRLRRVRELDVLDSSMTSSEGDP